MRPDAKTPWAGSSTRPVTLFAASLSLLLTACGAPGTTTFTGSFEDGGSTEGSVATFADATLTSPESRVGTPPDAAVPIDSPPTSTTPAHRRCGWIGPGDSQGAATFVANASYFDAIHPSWYRLANDSSSIATIAGEGDSSVLAAAAQNHVVMMPLVQAVGETAVLRGMLGSPQNQSTHIANLVALATSKGYDGLEIDYEGLWSSADRPSYEAFMSGLATAMHAAGKLVSVAAPAFPTPNPDSAYDYAFLDTTVDYVHMMVYDYHWLGGDHLGPVSPYGWADAVAAYAATMPNPKRFIFGVPVYGLGNGFACGLADCAATCGGSYATTTNHMQTCPYGTWAAGRSPNCVGSQGQVYFDDLASLEEKIQSAQAHGLGGVAHYAVGTEPPGFFDMVKKYF
jgi:spore germination protein YaaH